MKACLTAEKLLYHQNGSYYAADNHILSLMLRQFDCIDSLIKNEPALGSWNDTYSDISLVAGDIVAYINDGSELVIRNYSPFEPLWNDITLTFDNILTCEEYAKKVGKSPEQVKQFIRQNRIPGAVKIGRDWFVPVESIDKYPLDNRFTAGGKFSKYRQKE